MRLFFSRCHYYYYTNISTHQTVHLKLIVLYENCISIKLDKQLKTKMEWGMYQYYQCISAPQVGCLQAASHPSRQGKKNPCQDTNELTSCFLEKAFLWKNASWTNRVSWRGWFTFNSSSVWTVNKHFADWHGPQDTRGIDHHFRTSSLRTGLPFPNSTETKFLKNTEFFCLFLNLL